MKLEVNNGTPIYAQENTVYIYMYVYTQHTIYNFGIFIFFLDAMPFCIKLPVLYIMVVSHTIRV